MSLHLTTSDSQLAFSTESADTLVARSVAGGIMILDDQSDEPESLALARTTAMTSDLPVVSVTDRGLGFEVYSKIQPDVLLLDLGFGDSNLDAGINWIRMLSRETTIEAHVFAYSQYRVDDEHRALIEEVAPLDAVLSKEMPGRAVSDRILAEIDSDSRELVHFVVSGVHRDSELIAGVIPEWDPTRHVRVNTRQRSLFDVEPGAFWSLLSQGGELSTLVLLGRADTKAELDNELRLWLYRVAGEFAPEQIASLNEQHRGGPVR